MRFGYTDFFVSLMKMADGGTEVENQHTNVPPLLLFLNMSSKIWGLHTREDVLKQ